MTENQLAKIMVDACYQIHRTLGPGLLETVYEQCLCHELSVRGISFKREVAVPVAYKGIKLDCGFRLDLLVADLVAVELKAVDRVLPIHRAQLLTYLKITDKKLGLLINFNEELIKDGIHRVVNGLRYPESEDD